MDTKLNLATARNKLLLAKSNSDITNLATALVYFEEAEREAKEGADKVKALAARIEAGELVSVEEVQKLYNQSQGLLRKRI